MSTEKLHRTRSYSHPMRGGIYACFFAMIFRPCLGWLVEEGSVKTVGGVEERRGLKRSGSES
jgi:hypothetical protein